MRLMIVVLSLLLVWASLANADDAPEYREVPNADGTTTVVDADGNIIAVLDADGNPIESGSEEQEAADPLAQTHDYIEHDANSTMEDQMSGESQFANMPKGSGAHPIGWLELTTKDSEGFKAFYSAVFGWSYRPFAEDYFMYDTPKGLMGGVRVNPPDGSPQVTYYLYTPDINSKLAEIEAAGGKTVVPRFEVPGAGFMAFFSDPSEVIVGLAEIQMPQDYSPSPFTTQEGVLPSTITNIEVYGKDHEQTKAFYNGLFGWACTVTMPGYMAFEPGAGVGGVFQNHTPQAKVLAYVWVEDVAATLAKVVEAGGTKLGEPMVMPGMPVFGYFLDPYGNGFGIIGPK